MSDISELEGRLTAALERIARGVDGMQASASEPEEGEDVQALRRALENEALVTAQMEERVRALTARQTELEEELSAAQADKAAAEEALGAAESKAEAADAAVTTAEARAEAAETAAVAAADAAEDGAPASAPEGDAEHREMLEELAKRLRRLRQMARRERSANQVLREQVEKEGMVDPSAVNEALKADLDALSALREAENAETAIILTELRPLVQGMVVAPEADADMPEPVEEGDSEETLEPLEDAGEETKETGDA